MPNSKDFSESNEKMTIQQLVNKFEPSRNKTTEPVNTTQKNEHSSVEIARRNFDPVYKSKQEAKEDQQRIEEQREERRSKFHKDVKDIGLVDTGEVKEKAQKFGQIKGQKQEIKEIKEEKRFYDDAMQHTTKGATIQKAKEFGSIKEPKQVNKRSASEPRELREDIKEDLKSIKDNSVRSARDKFDISQDKKTSPERKNSTQKMDSKPSREGSLSKDIKKSSTHVEAIKNSTSNLKGGASR